jgi:hypothetical protein
MASIWRKTRSTAGPLNQTYKPPAAKKPPVKPKAVQAAYNPLNPINFDQYKTTSASVGDISKKYGIDFSREYAKRQAEAAAQAKRDALNNQQKQTDLGVRNAQDALSRDYFQKGLASAQAGVNGGMNAGFQNEANIRLGMNRQAEMADIFRQANLKRDEIQQGLKTVDAERMAQEEQMYQDRLQMAAELINQNRSLDQGEKQMLLNAMLEQRNQAINMDQFSQQLGWDKYRFNNMSATEKANLDWDKYQFNNMSATDRNRLNWDKYMFNNMSATDRNRLNWDKYQFNNMSAAERANLDWNRYQFNNLSASDKEANKLAYARLAEEKRQFKSEMDWRKYQYNNMSAAEKANFDEGVRQFGEEMQWRKYELEYTSEMALEEARAAAGMSGTSSNFLVP